MMELLGPMSRSMALGGVKYRKMFDRAGQLRRIRGLNYWPLHKVLHEKYRMKESEAKAFADFLMPMLEWDPDRRASAQSMLSHPWLSAESNYDTRMSEEEIEIKLKRDELKKQKKDLAQTPEELADIDFEEEELRIETSKLVDDEIELNMGDDELSTLSTSELDKNSMMSSDEESDDSFTITKPE